MSHSKGIGGHQSPAMIKDEWLTPPGLIRTLGEFDLDPCSPSPDVRPWDTARMHFCRKDDGLTRPWSGRVWLNPPYGRETGKWLSRLADHADGIALIFARTETDMFFRYVWNRASGILFLRGRLHFHHVDGSRASFNAGAPSCLIAYGSKNVNALAECGLPGKLLEIAR